MKHTCFHTAHTYAHELLAALRCSITFVHVDCVIPRQAYLVEVQLIKQVHEPFILALLTKHSVVLDQSMQRQLGLIIYIHLHWLQCMSCWSASQNLDMKLHLNLCSSGSM